MNYPPWAYFYTVGSCLPHCCCSPCIVFHLWSLVFGLSSLAFGLSSLVFRLSSFVFGLSSIVFGLWSFVFGLSSLAFRIGLSSLVFRVVSSEAIRSAFFASDIAPICFENVLNLFWHIQYADILKQEHFRFRFMTSVDNKLDSIGKKGPAQLSRAEMAIYRNHTCWHSYKTVNSSCNILSLKVI